MDWIQNLAYGLGLVLVAVANWIHQRANAQAIENARAEAQNNKTAVLAKVEEIHQATNGMKAELIKVVGEKEFAAGKESERLNPSGQGGKIGIG